MSSSTLGRLLGSALRHRFTVLFYYYIFVILFLTYIYTFIEEKKNKNLYKFIVVLYFGLMFFRVLYYWDGGDMAPYKTIYQDFYRPHLYDHFEYRARKY